MSKNSKKHDLEGSDGTEVVASLASELTQFPSHLWDEILSISNDTEYEFYKDKQTPGE